MGSIGWPEIIIVLIFFVIPALVALWLYIKRRSHNRKQISDSIPSAEVVYSCSNCGTQLPRDSKFCPQCGFKLLTASQSISQSQSQMLKAFSTISVQPKPQQANAADISIKKFHRLGNLVFDLIAISFISIPVTIIVLLLIILINVASSVDNNLDIFIDLIVIATTLSYYIFCEYFFGRTLGKLLTKSRVITLEGNKPSFFQIVGRTLVRFIPFEPFSVLFSARAIGWHDLLSRTRVVKSVYKQNA
jgi:uncharacterized RDD family membrane protein YckC/DNA-directed RNA polymerase subunit RPC12/RpoP